MKNSKISLLTIAIILSASIFITFSSCEKDDDVKSGKAESIALLSGNNQTGKITKELTNPIEIVIKDQNGIAFKNSTISVEVIDGLASTTTAQTDANGKATVNWTLANNLGTQTLIVKAFNEDGTTALQGSPITVTATAICIEVGDEYAGGIVFYVDNNCGGLVCAKIDQNSGNGIQWAGSQNSTIGATGTAIGTGQENTTAILNEVGTSIDYAARICDELDLEGYSDWFLPSKAELDLMYQNLHKATSPMGNFQAEFYWSSTEDDGGDAWLQEFNADGNQNYDAKDAERLVRAVRVFINN